MIAGFKKKIIVDKATLGQTFRRARKQKEVSLKDAARATLIRLFYLKDLEEDNFKSMPTEPYGSFFVKKYAHFLGLSTKKMVLWYQRQANVLNDEQELEAPQELQFSFFGFLRSKLRVILVGLILIVVVTSFMAYEVAGMTQGPKLTVVAPSQNESVVSAALFKVSGVTDEESSVYIDGVLVDQNNGSFEHDVILAKGLNKIIVEAKDNVGKSTVKTFSILRK
jgi:cytoskeletal protein RodZ